MAHNYGKDYERKVREDLRKVPGISFIRLFDQMSGYKSISNIADICAYCYPELIYLELKSVHGNTFPLGNLTQYDKLIQHKGIKGVIPGVLIWFIDHDKEIFVPIESFERIKNEGYKSINIRTIDLEEYGITLVPTVKKRVFLDSDFRALFRGVEYYEKVNE